MGKTVAAAVAMGLRGHELSEIKRQIRAEQAEIHETVSKSRNRRKNRIAAASRKRNRRKH